LKIAANKENPIISGQIRPAGAAKKGDPITAAKVIANREVGSFGLAKFGFSFVAATIAEDKKDDQSEDSQKDHNDGDLDSNEQHASQCQELSKQGDDQENERGDAGDCFKK
jgi:hypothetical protein